MSTRTKLQFRRIECFELMPDGYRFATVEEFSTNLADIKSRGFMEDEKRKGRLLDGRILAGYRLEKSSGWCFWGLVVKEKVWDEETDRWKKKSSACYPSDGNLLRTKLYDGIDLSEEGRKSAFSLALANEDPEVLCWLLKPSNSEVQNDDGQVRYEDCFGPSLKQVVKNYVVELYDLQKVSNNEDFHDKDRIMIETQEDYSKLKECLKNDPFVKAIFSLYGHDTTTTQEREEQYSNWINLFKVLHDVQDVSMKGIQLFQQFRLHCEIDSLPWPLPESNAIAYNRLMHA